MLCPFFHSVSHCKCRLRTAAMTARRTYFFIFFPKSNQFRKKNYFNLRLRHCLLFLLGLLDERATGVCSALHLNICFHQALKKRATEQIS
jgi:hypothetical protein